MVRKQESNHEVSVDPNLKEVFFQLLSQIKTVDPTLVEIIPKAMLIMIFASPSILLMVKKRQQTENGH